MLDALGYVGLLVVDGAADQRSLRFSSTLFIRALVPVGARFYHIYICSWASMVQHADSSLFLFRATSYMGYQHGSLQLHFTSEPCSSYFPCQD